MKYAKGSKSIKLLLFKVVVLVPSLPLSLAPSLPRTLAPSPRRPLA
jgi:hypothetical protein